MGNRPTYEYFRLKPTPVFAKGEQLNFRSSAMIAFSCSQCGMKLQVQADFAGRMAQCPTCKQRVIVPQSESGLTENPAASLERHDGVTLAASESDDPNSLGHILAKRQPGAGRYVIDKEIARGGMGAVSRAVDCDIRREVAVKYLLDEHNQQKKDRFIEEAQITGQLEHPNIVPIHELGLDSQKRIFFSMKMVHGRSLAEVLSDLRKNDAKEWTLSRLLGVLVNVCNAIAYAHSRNVLHRDLKPANIMVGEFGEVYVMDWGLAKIFEPHRPIINLAPMDEPETGHLSAPIATARDESADLTKEGTVLGTPLYMAPEQARGEVGSLDQRTDIYALGALLYEMLTLKPPVDSEGGFVTIVKRVRDGQILPPHVRVPERARQMPHELAAIAVKALAKDPERRYPSALAFRRDVERYLEGRSVSAKEDSAWETFSKFVKRNKAVSAATGLALLVLTVVLGIAFWVNSAARLHAEDQQRKAIAAREKYQQEQEDKERAIRNAVPAFINASRQLANDGDIKSAVVQAELALAYEPKNLDARLLKAQILLAQRDWKAGRAELDSYLRVRPRDARAIALKATCEPGKEKNIATLFELAGLFQEQKIHGLAKPILLELAKHAESRKPLFALYQKQIKAVWPGLENSHKLAQDGSIFLDCNSRKDVTDLSPLEGMLINKMNMTNTPVKSIAALKGMPLTYLEMRASEVVDLEPLKGMKLKEVNLSNSLKIVDLTPLKGMPIERLDISSTGVSNLEPVRGMPLTALFMDMTKVSSLEPLRGMRLATFDMNRNQHIRDLSPLKDMPLTKLVLSNCSLISDLSPLRGSPLTQLGMFHCPLISDLSPLEGMAITSLDLTNCSRIVDITPLKEVPLTTLILSGTKVTSLEPLRGMKLTNLACGTLQDANLEPLRGMQLINLNLYQCTMVDNIEALEGMPLAAINFSPKFIRKGMDVLRAMKTLRSISANGMTYGVEDFWRRYDAGEFVK